MVSGNNGDVQSSFVLMRTLREEREKRERRKT
jgi:hypothetical protein